MKADVTKGHLYIPETPGWAKLLAKFDGPVDVQVTKWSAQRSIQQNSYYHGVVIPGAIEVFRYLWGQILTPAVAHRLLKSIFLGKEEILNRKTGEVVLVGGSSAELTTSEFHAYIESIRAWAFEEAQIVIDPPDYGGAE